MGQAPHRPQAGVRLRPELCCRPRAPFTDSSPRVEQLVSRPGTGQLLAVPRGGRLGIAALPAVPERAGAPRLGCRAPRDCETALLGDFPPQGTPQSFYFFPGEPLLRGLCWARVFSGDAGPAAVPGSGLSRPGVPGLGEKSGTTPLPLQRV